MAKRKPTRQVISRRVSTATSKANKSLMGLASKLNQLRIEKNKSLQQVADAVRASKTHIWDLERGNTANPSMNLLDKLATFYKVSISDLVGENPDNLDELDQEAVAMFRDLKNLSESDREIINRIMDGFAIKVLSCSQSRSFEE